METIPFEVYKLVFRNLGIYDLISCSRTCKKLKESVKQFEIEELLFINNNNVMIDTWFYTHKPPDYDSCVFEDLSLNFLKTSPLSLCCLKRLKILDSANGLKTFDLKILNNFTQLVQLDIKLHDHKGDEIIELNNLKILSVDLLDSTFEKVIAPKLFALHLDYLYSVDSFLDPIKFKYPKTITHLEVSNCYYHVGDLAQFENVTFFKTGCKNFKNFFQLLPKIEVVHFTHLQEFFSHDGFDHLLKRVLTKREIAVYFFGLKFYENENVYINKFLTEDGFLHFPSFSIQMKNYSLLSERLNWITEFNYDVILKHIINVDSLPADWFDRFSNIQVVSAHQVENQHQFISFIVKLKSLQRLELNNASLTQEFYDSLPRVKSLSQLIHNESREDSTLNFDFINKIEFLQILRSTQKLSISQVINFFIKLRHLRKLSIINEDEILGHKKSGLYHLTYLKKGNPVEKILSLEQLIDLYEKYS